MVFASALHTPAPTCQEQSALDPPRASLCTEEDEGFVLFQRRVFEEGRDEATPLLERAKFLAIVGANVDDFVMAHAKRCAATSGRSGWVARALIRLTCDADRHWRVHVAPGLRAHGFDIASYARLSPDEREGVDARFRDAVLPRVRVERWMPGASPCPRPENLTSWFIAYDRDQGVDAPLHILWVPDDVTALIPAASPSTGPTPGGRRAPLRVVWTDEVVMAQLRYFVPDLRTPVAHRCRVLCHAGIPVVSGHPSSQTPENVLACLRADRQTTAALIVEARTPAAVVRALEAGWDVPPGAAWRAARVFPLRRLWDVYHAGPNALRFPHCDGREAVGTDVDVWAAIRREDILLHHPYDTFDPVVALLEAAAHDASVRRIQITLYRTDRESAVVAALVAAVARGVDVRVVVELHARFDEARNARTALRLSAAGALVVHAPRGLKVHAKALLIDRIEGAEVRCYAHVSSGNYNRFTSTMYTDVALLTADVDTTRDLTHLFDDLARAAAPGPSRRIAAAPSTLRRRLSACIDREMAHARRGRPSRIVLKMNALTDRTVIDALYAASRAGVPIDLIVRGACCLRPGVPGVSDTIRVRSIVGRFLEHSRIWYFHNGGADDVYIGSADVMRRSLDQRVEIMVPVRHAAHQARIRAILTAYLHDTVKARELDPGGSYLRVRPRAEAEPFDAQFAFIQPGAC